MRFSARRRVTNTAHARVSRMVRLAEPSDDALIARVLAGEMSAYTQLVARYRAQAARYATRIVGNQDDAEDVVQDTFVRAFRSLHQCADPARFEGWLYRILINRCRTASARAARRQRTFLDEQSLPASVLPGDEERGWRDEIGRALARLDIAYREAFVLKHVEELSYDEMSALTGVGVSALKMRVKRACEQLRVMLEATYCA
jgi:RNA polymerase sigma-70 factor, ECF subfamily